MAWNQLNSYDKSIHIFDHLIFGKDIAFTVKDFLWVSYGKLGLFNLDESGKFNLIDTSDLGIGECRAVAFDGNHLLCAVDSNESGIYNDIAVIDF